MMSEEPAQGWVAECVGAFVTTDFHRPGEVEPAQSGLLIPAMEGCSVAAVVVWIPMRVHDYVRFLRLENLDHRRMPSVFEHRPPSLGIAEATTATGVTRVDSMVGGDTKTEEQAVLDDRW
jgi:hypothetical protein